MAMFTDDEVHTAMCLWEAFIDLQLATGNDGLPTPEAERACEIRSTYGSCTLRQILAGQVKACDTAWDAYSALAGNDGMCFDFEFVPNFLDGLISDGRLTTALQEQYVSA